MITKESKEKINIEVKKWLENLMDYACKLNYKKSVPCKEAINNLANNLKEKILSDEEIKYIKEVHTNVRTWVTTRILNGSKFKKLWMKNSKNGTRLFSARTSFTSFRGFKLRKKIFKTNIPIKSMKRIYCVNKLDRDIRNKELEKMNRVFKKVKHKFGSSVGISAHMTAKWILLSNVVNCRK